MVKEITKTIYKCPYCEDEFEDEYRCLDHIDDCLDKESPEEDEIVKYQCDYCSKIFEKEEDCEECEIKHSENEDKFYNQIKLKQASEHPSQKKLIIGAF